MKVIDTTEQQFTGGIPARQRPNLGHKGNGNPNRPSVIKRREARAERRRKDEKNRKAREARAAKKAASA